MKLLNLNILIFAVIAMCSCASVEKAKHYTGNHDVGFMVGCSFGNAYRLMGGDRNRDVVLIGANSLMTRYKPEMGLIRSWDWNQKEWKHPVIIDHPNMPEDMVPYWDFDAPDQPNCYRDASAASLIASALIELSQYVDDEDEAAKYLAVAERQIRSLASEEYSVPIGTHGNFILKKSVGAFPGRSEVDKPLTYADYYYVEAMMRYKKLKGYK